MAGFVLYLSQISGIVHVPGLDVATRLLSVVKRGEGNARVGRMSDDWLRQQQLDAAKHREMDTLP